MEFHVVVFAGAAAFVVPRQNILRCGFDPEREAQWPAMLDF